VRSKRAGSAVVVEAGGAARSRSRRVGGEVSVEASGRRGRGQGERAANDGEGGDSEAREATVRRSGE
jgi:hypothetical protein